MFVLTYDPNGSWTMVQTSPDGSPINNPVFRGLIVTGDRIRHDVEFPARYAAEGAHDEVSWRLEGGSLHLELVAAGDEIIRVIYERIPGRGNEIAPVSGSAYGNVGQGRS